AVAEADGVAVRCAGRERAGADGAAGAGAVVDDDLLAEEFGELVADRAHHDGGTAAGRKRDHEGDRTGRIVLSAGRDDAPERGGPRGGQEAASSDGRAKSHAKSSAIHAAPGS